MFQWKATNVIFLNDDVGGKGKYFKARFLQAGLVKYSFGVCELSKETIDKFVQDFVGCPVIINHKEVTNESAKDDRVGTISKVWFDETDGWYWCEGIIFEQEAIDLINQGYSVSCQYEITEYSENKTGALHNGNPYDKTILNGKPEHLAIVKNPRYENAMIAVNAMEINIEAQNEEKEFVTVGEGEGQHVIPVDYMKKDDKDTKPELHIMSKEELREHSKLRTMDKEELIKTYLIDKDSIDAEDDLKFYKQFSRSNLLDRIYAKMKKNSKDDKDTKKEKNKETNKGYSLSDKYKNHIQFENDKESMGYPRKIYESLDAAKKSYEMKKESQVISEEENLKRTGRRGIALRDFPVIVENPLGNGYVVATVGLQSKYNLKEVYPIKRDSETKKPAEYKQLNLFSKNDLIQAINEIKETIMFKNLFKKRSKEMEKEELKTLLMECLEDMTARNEAVDKRKLIDEIGGILKGKVDDEIIRTIIKKAEELSYNPSEKDKADNEADKEEVKEEDKKEEEKEEKKEDAENKCGKNEETENCGKNADDEEKKEAKNAMDEQKNMFYSSNDTSSHSTYLSKSKAIELGNQLF